MKAAPVSVAPRMPLCTHPRYFASCAASGSAFHQFVKRRFESPRKFLRRASSPVMEEDHHRPVSRHVMMNRDYIETVLAKRFQNRGDFAFQHRYIARDRSVLLCAHE